MSPRTIFLSRLLGLYLVFVALAMMLNKHTTVQTVTDLVHSAPLMLLVGILTLAAGLALVLSHNIWSAGPATAVVTLAGWLTLLKGLSFVFLAPERQANFYLNTLHYPHLFYFYAGISLVLGAYLTYAGFSSPRS